MNKKASVGKILLMGIRNNKEIFILLGLSIFIWSIYFWANFNGLVTGDAMHYAATARNIVRGHGILDDDIWPANFLHLKSNYFRNLRNPPLYPIVLSIFFFILGISDFSAAVCSGVFYLLSAPLLYLLGKELFNTRVGVVSAIGYILSPQLLYYSISGLTESLFIFLLLVCFYLLYKSSTFWQFLMVGVVLGVSRLVRLNAIFFILPFILYIYFIYSSKKNILNFILGFCIMTLPEIIRGYSIFKDPIFCGYSSGVLHFINSPDRLARTIIESNRRFNYFGIVFLNSSRFIKYYLSNLLRYYYGFLKLSPYFISISFVFSMFRWNQAKKVSLIKAAFLGGLLLQTLVLSVSYQEIRYYHIFIPFIILFAVEFMFYVLDEIPFKQSHSNLVLGCIIIFSISRPLSNLITIGYNKSVVSRPNYKYYWIKDFLAENTSPTDVVMTDIAEPVAWYGDRKTIQLPLSIAMLTEIDREHTPVGAVLLTSYTCDGRPWRPVLEEWRDLYKEEPKKFEYYELLDTSHDGREIVLLYKKGK